MAVLASLIVIIFSIIWSQQALRMHLNWMHMNSPNELPGRIIKEVKCDWYEVGVKDIRYQCRWELGFPGIWVTSVMAECTHFPWFLNSLSTIGEVTWWSFLYIYLNLALLGFELLAWWLSTHFPWFLDSLSTIGEVTWWSFLYIYFWSSFLITYGMNSYVFSFYVFYLNEQAWVLFHFPIMIELGQHLLFHMYY